MDSGPGLHRREDLGRPGKVRPLSHVTPLLPKNRLLESVGGGGGGGPWTRVSVRTLFPVLKVQSTWCHPHNRTSFSVIKFEGVLQ